MESFEAIGYFLCGLFGVEPPGDFFNLFWLVEIDDCVPDGDVCEHRVVKGTNDNLENGFGRFDVMS